MRETIIKKGLQNLLLLYLCVNFAITKISSSNRTFLWPAAFSWRSSSLTKRGHLSTPISNVHNNPRNKKKGKKKKKKKKEVFLLKEKKTF